MKTIVNIILCLAFTVLTAGMAAGCGDVVTGSGVTQTLEFDYANFSRIEISTGFEMEITRADSFFVNLTLDKSLYEYLNIAQRGDILHIGLKPNYTYTAASRKGIIHLPDIRRLDLSGGTKATVTGFTMTHDIDFELTGGSSLVLKPMQAGDTTFTLSGASTAQGNIQTNNGQLDVSGGSTLILDGAAKDMKIKASGASSISIQNLPLTTAGVELSGASHAIVKVSDIIDVNLSGGSELEYYGNPKLGSMEISGGSKFNQVKP
jgi:hypothetical protein